jgi:hypothetical protein
MYRALLFIVVSSLIVSCSSSHDDTITKKQDEKAQKVEQTSSQFVIIGKWLLYEDVDRNGLENEKATFIFQENGEVKMVENIKSQKIGKYEFSQKFNTLTIEGEMVDIEIVDNNNVLLKGKHGSGNKFVSQLVRQ